MTTAKSDLDSVSLRSASQDELFRKLCDKNSGVTLSAMDDFLSIMLTKNDNNQDPSEFMDAAKLIFKRFDKDGDSLLNENEFGECYAKWMKKVLWPKTCLLVIDVQNDFISGSLALKNAPAKQDGEEVVPVINELLKTVKFDTVVYSMDWHPDDHCSFIDNIHLQNIHPDSKVKKEDAKLFDTVLLDDDVPIEQMLFPKHCVQCTHGAEIHPDLLIVSNPSGEPHIVKKGTNPKAECFSAFQDNAKKHKTELDGILSVNGITDVYICGLAADFCVACSALDALEFGYRTVIVEDATRASNEERIAFYRSMLFDKGVSFISSKEVGEMVLGHKRPIEFALEVLRRLA